MEVPHIMGAVFRHLQRVLGAGAGFLLLQVLFAFLVFCAACLISLAYETKYPPKSPTEFSILIDEIANYEREHNGKLPNSLLEISPDLDDRFGIDYVIVAPNCYRSTTAQLEDFVESCCSYFGIRFDCRRSGHEPCQAIIASRRPTRSILPFPFAVHSAFHPDPASCDMDSPLTQSHYGSLCDLDSRRLSVWATGQTNVTNQTLRRYDLAVSFIPDILQYLAIVAILALLIRRCFRTLKSEKERYGNLEKLSRELAEFSAEHGRLPVSESELRSKIERIPGAYGLGTFFQYWGDMPLIYDGHTVVIATRKSWLAPSWPFFGGKRGLLLLEDGQIVKLQGDSSLRKFFELVHNSPKIFRVDFDRPLSNSFFDEQSTPSSKTRSLNEPCGLEMRRERYFVKIVKTVYTSTLLGFGIVVAGGATMTLFRILTFDCASQDSYTMLGLTLACLGFPYWVVLSNYFADV